MSSLRRLIAIKNRLITLLLDLIDFTTNTNKVIVISENLTQLLCAFFATVHMFTASVLHLQHLQLSHAFFLSVKITTSDSKNHISSVPVMRFSLNKVDLWGGSIYIYIIYIYNIYIIYIYIHWDDDDDDDDDDDKGTQWDGHTTFFAKKIWGWNRAIRGINGINEN